jgi:hypothetical protein
MGACGRGDSQDRKPQTHSDVAVFLAVGNHPPHSAKLARPVKLDFPETRPFNKSLIKEM